MRLRQKGRAGGDARLTGEPLLLDLKEGAELDEGGEAAAGHVRHGVLEEVVEAAQDVVDEVPILDAVPKFPESVHHLLELGGVVHDGKLALDEVMELVEEVCDASVPVAAEEGEEGPPECVGRVLAVRDDLQSRGSHGGVVPQEDGEVSEHPVGGGLAGEPST